MKRAQKRDAVNSEKFYFRKSLLPEDEEEAAPSAKKTTNSHDHEFTLMSVDTIINGKVLDWVEVSGDNEIMLSCRMSFLDCFHWFGCMLTA